MRGRRRRARPCPAAIGPRDVSTPIDAPVRRRRCRSPRSPGSRSTPSASARARVAPRDVVVPGDAAARLVGRAEHRVAHVGRDVEDRAELAATSSGSSHSRVDAVEPVRVDPPHALAHVVQVVREVEHAALAEQQVVVELRPRALPTA